jgi:hypothetical protein
MGVGRTDYDFSCGHDSRMVRMAIKNDSFHALQIQAEYTKAIDFSGGTKNIDEILLSKCFRLTRITWPDYGGTIKCLRINFADRLTRLDVSTLVNLQELSIINCNELTEIIGLGPKLRFLNVHGAKIKKLDVSKCKLLEVFNVITILNHFEVDLSRHDSLRMVSIEAKSEVGEKK